MPLAPSPTQLWRAAGIRLVPDPLGGGSADNTWFETWLANETAAGDVIQFRAGKTYLQDGMVRYLPQRTYVWPGNDEPSTKWMVKDSVAMPATSGMWVPKVWDDNSTTGQNPVDFIHPVLDGNKANTTGGHHGLIMGGSHWYTIERPEIFNQRGEGVRLTNLAKNGSTVLGGDAADGNIFNVRLFDNLGCGLRQVLDAGNNAHMDVQLRGGRIFGNGESGVLGDRLAGWDISYLHIFTVQHYAIRSIDGGFDLAIHHNQIEDFNLAGGATFRAGISVKFYDNQGPDISHNRVRMTPEDTAEPGSGSLAYINIEAAPDPEALCVVAHNEVYGTDSPRSGVVGMNFNCTLNTLWVDGLHSNIVRRVAVPYAKSGVVHDPHRLYVRKTANETVTSSTTLQNDDHLALPVQASAVYQLELFLIYDGDSAGDIAIDWTLPSGASIDYQPGGATTSAAAQSATVKQGHSVNAAAEGYGAVGTGSGNRMVARANGLVQVGSTAGTLQLRWAQLASSATATTVLAGSYLRLTRIA